MITVRGQLYLTDLGAHERIYEGVKAGVDVTFSKGKATLDKIEFSNSDSKYFESVGSSLSHWINLIQGEFVNSGDYVLDLIIENLPDDEYARAENYITAYYKNYPMPDGEV